MVNGGAAAAGAAVAIAEAIKASGAIVRVEPRDFQTILSRAESPLVVTARGGFLYRKFCYLTAYKGLVFFTKSEVPIPLGGVETIAAKSIWIPG
jgi:hypothetical protein